MPCSKRSVSVARLKSDFLKNTKRVLFYDPYRTCILQGYRPIELSSTSTYEYVLHYCQGYIFRGVGERNRGYALLMTARNSAVQSSHFFSSPCNHMVELVDTHRVSTYMKKITYIESTNEREREERNRKEQTQKEDIYMYTTSPSI